MDRFMFTLYIYAHIVCRMILKLGFTKFEIIQQTGTFVLGRLEDFLDKGS